MGNRIFVDEDQLTEESLGNFASLPTECLYEILAYCDAASLTQLSSLNRLFHSVASDNVRLIVRYVMRYTLISIITGAMANIIYTRLWLPCGTTKSIKG